MQTLEDLSFSYNHVCKFIQNIFDSTEIKPGGGGRKTIGVHCTLFCVHSSMYTVIVTIVTIIIKLNCTYYYNTFVL